VAIAGTFMLFLFWTIPVAFAQSLATLQNLANAFPFLQGLVNAIEAQGPNTVNFVQSTLSSWVLIGLRALTLNSGLFQWFARLSGALTHTEIQARSTGLMMLFQLIMVLLGSLISSTLFDTLESILQNPTQLPQLLAASLPSQSVFFLNFLNTTAVVVCLTDLLRLFPLVMLAFSRCCCTKGDRARCLSNTAKQNVQDYKIGYDYAKLVLAIQIALVFMFIAPVMSLMVLVYTLLTIAIMAKTLDECFDTPLVDTAGVLWEQAVVYEGYSLVIAQLLLFGLLLKKEAYVSAPFILTCAVLTLVRLLQLRSNWGRKARNLPLRVAMELDHERLRQGGANLAADLLPYTMGGLRQGKAKQVAT